MVSSTPTPSISGTATRSASATACGPPHTTAVAASPIAIDHAVSDPNPNVFAHTDAAMTLFSAIHAKFVTYRTPATTPAPPKPSAGRVAITDGTRSRGPIGASAATSVAPTTLPAAIKTIATRIENDPARLAPT